MDTNKKLHLVRELMIKSEIDAYIVPSSDPHNSEYISEIWKQREWLSGFSGSYGELIITKQSSALWTDSRYFIQAEEELKGSEIKLFKIGTTNCINKYEWLSTELPKNSKIGVFSICTTATNFLEMSLNLRSKGIEIVESKDIINIIRNNNIPSRDKTSVLKIDDNDCGESLKSKLCRFRDKLAANKADVSILSALDEIAWLYNIRGCDIDYNPVVISYSVVTKDKAILFIDKDKLSEDILLSFKANDVEIMPYEQIFEYINKDIDYSTFAIDITTLNYTLYSILMSKYNVNIWSSPIIDFKAIKNKTEISGFRNSMIKDGISMIKFLHWLELTVKSGCNIDEKQASDMLSSIRAQDKDYISNSFSNISAYGKNAALPHYSYPNEGSAIIENKGLYLVDSGAHYKFGTTDITRTIPMDVVSELEKTDYTIALKGMINLTMATFPLGSKGCNIDLFARKPLWDNKINYGHGTGHGVGFFLNVHEGPMAIRQELRDKDILPGMVISNEPGIYRENYHGIRHENIILCVEKETNEFGHWLGFETLTLCYFDTSAIIKDLLDSHELEWLNSYNTMVYKKISPYLDMGTADWLYEKTQLI